MPPNLRARLYVVLSLTKSPASGMGNMVYNLISVRTSHAYSDLLSFVVFLVQLYSKRKPSIKGHYFRYSSLSRPTDQEAHSSISSENAFVALRAKSTHPSGMRRGGADTSLRR